MIFATFSMFPIHREWTREDPYSADHSSAWLGDLTLVQLASVSIFKLTHYPSMGWMIACRAIMQPKGITIWAYWHGGFLRMRDASSATDEKGGRAWAN